MSLQSQIQELKLKNDPESMVQLGKIYAFGPADYRDIQKAISLFTTAAKSEHSDALFYLALINSSGVGVKIDFKLSAKLLEQSVALANGKACFLLNKLYQNKLLKLEPDFAATLPTQAKSLLESTSSADSESLYYLGLVYQNADATPQDSVKAIELLQQATDMGNSNALLELAKLYCEGEGVPQDLTKAQQLLEQAITLGNDAAMCLMGKLCLTQALNLQATQTSLDAHKTTQQSTLVSTTASTPESISVAPPDASSTLVGTSAHDLFVKAQQYFTQAIELGNAEAMFELALMFKQGYGVTPNNAQFFNLLKQAAALGEPASLTELSKQYFIGECVKKSFSKSRQLLEQAVELGSPEAMSSLALFYQEGIGGAKKTHKAIALLKRASAMQRPSAMFKLAQIYQEGKGVQEDKKKAQELFSAAANLGYEPAVTFLLEHVYDVEHTEDLGKLSKAKDMLEQAVACGSAEAMFKLAQMYGSGKGVEANLLQAKELLEQAIALGHVEAISVLSLAYMTGDSHLPKDETKAQQLMQEAFKAGSKFAQVYMKRQELLQASESAKQE